MKLGKINQKERINFRTFLKSHYVKGQEYSFVITTIFEPKQFPTWRFIMQDENSDLEISRTFKDDVAREVLKENKFSRTKPIEKILYFKIYTDGEQEIVAQKSNSTGYIYQGWGWRLVDLKEDIPF